MNVPLSSRRQFLRTVGCGLAACAVGGVAPQLLAATRAAGGSDEPRALILLQLEGGHDGLATFAPLGDDDYHRLRPTLAPARRDLIALDQTTGLHRAGRGLEPLFKDGRLAVLPAVGLATPSPSHFRATEIWHTGSDAGLPPYAGWLGRSLDVFAQQERAVAAYYGGRRLPRILVRDGDRGRGGALAANDRRRPLALAAGDAAAQLAEIGARAGEGKGSEVYFVSVPGFDTHFDQTDRHASRLAVAADALLALQQRLEQRGVAGRVLTVVFSEFGRSVAENAQGGTDHGAAGPVLLLGSRVRGDFHGHPAVPLDFRRVIATVTDRWLQLPLGAVIGGGYGALPLLT
jgi:uncharacterized protein (DUF1501 family)